MDTPHKFKLCSGKDITIDVQESDPDPKHSITSHAVPDTISESGIRSTHCIETGISYPAQVTIEVEEKPLYDVQERYMGETYNENQFSHFLNTGNPSGTDSTVTLGQKKVDQCKVQVIKKVNSGRKAVTMKTTTTVKDETTKFSCFFCKTPFISGLKVMHIVLDKQLPSSSLDPLSLLHCFGMEFPVSKKFDPTGFTPVDICGKCYVVISDCDILYPYIHSAITKILEVWPEKMDGMKTLSLNITLSAKPLSGSGLKPRNSYPKAKNKLPMPDVQLSFSYLRTSDFASQLSEKLDKSSVRQDFSEAPQKVCLQDIFTCGFCGTAFHSEEDWCNHIDTDHKILRNWQSYNLQTVLKRFISKEVHLTDSQVQKRGRDMNECKCCACNSTFPDSYKLLNHLYEYHNMVIEKPKTECQNSEALLKLKCKEEQNDFEDDSKSFAFSEGSGSIGDVADVESEYQESAVKKRLMDDDNFSPKKGSEGNIKKVYAPHWRCRICGMLFSSQEVVMKHRKQAHPESTRVIKKKVFDDSYDENSSGLKRIKKEIHCPVCNQCVDGHEALREHLQVIHQKYMVVLQKKTPPSRERFTEKVGLLRKTKGGKNQNPQPVKGDLGYCVVLKGDGQGGVNDQRVKIDDEMMMGSDSSETLNLNPDAGTVEEEREKKISCGICRKEFANRILMAEHSCSVREDADTSESKENVGISDEIVMLECKLCDRRLHGVTALRIHMARIHGDPSKKRQNRHRCKICAFQTRLRSQFYKHMKDNHSIDIQPPVKCFVCGKMYNSHYINRHITVVHGTTNNKKYACKFCDMKYHDLVYLKRHVYFDHANTKWKCQVCQKEFEKYHQLRQHRVNDHGTKEYKCMDCEKTFKRKGDLTTHRKRRHQAKVPAVCSFCSKTYCEPSKLRAHLIEKHEVPWEHTLSARYARHQQENNCLKRHTIKDGKVSSATSNPEEFSQEKPFIAIDGNSGLPTSKASHKEEIVEEYHQADQQEYVEGTSGQSYSQGEVPKESIVTDYESQHVNVLPTSTYNVVEVTEDNVENIGEIGYIIYEEANN